jgi:hypothetical protein
MLREERNIFEKGGWILRKVVDYPKLCDFDCGHDDLNEFFQKDALSQKQELLNETFALYEVTEESDCPVALISLCNDAIRKESIIAFLGFKGTKKEYPFYPAVKLARFGVVKDLRGKCIGTHAINMIKELFLTNNRTGCRLVTVDAYNRDEVLNFYRKNDFEFFSDKDKNKQQRSMFYDLKRLQL